MFNFYILMASLFGANKQNHCRLEKKQYNWFERNNLLLFRIFLIIVIIFMIILMYGLISLFWQPTSYQNAMIYPEKWV